MFAQTQPSLVDLRLTQEGVVHTMVLQEDGKLLIGGEFTSVNAVSRNNIARLNPDGSLDLTWEPNADGPVEVMAISGTNVFVAGRFSSIGGRARPGLAKLTTLGSGRADARWNPVPTGAFEPRALAVAGTNVFVGGYIQQLGGFWRSHLAKLDAFGQGAVDSIWAPEPDSQVTALVVHGDHLVVGGYFSEIGGLPRSKLAKVRIEGRGEADPTWNPSVEGVFVDPEYVDFLASSGTNLFVSGLFDRIGGLDRKCLAKIDLMGSGAADPGWFVSLTFDERPQCLAADDSYLYVGRIKYTTSVNLVASKFQSDTAAESTVCELLSYAWPHFASIHAILPSAGQVLVGGEFPKVSEEVSMSLARLDPIAMRRDRSFPAQVGKPGTVKAMARQPDGKLLVGGQFLMSGNLIRQNLLRVGTDGEVDLTWAPDADESVDAIAVDENAVFVGGAFSRIGGFNRQGLAKFVLAGPDRPDALWNPGVYATSPAFYPPYVNALVRHGAHLVVGGRFGLIGGAEQVGVAKLSADGAGQCDRSWTPQFHPSAWVATVQIDGSNVFVGGWFSAAGNAGEVVRYNLAKLDLKGRGELDPAWGPLSTNLVVAMVLLDTNLFVARQHIDFTWLPFEPFLEKFSTLGAGASDLQWHPEPSWNVSALAASGANLYVAGEFLTIGGQSIPRLAKLDAFGNGQADPGWAPRPDGPVFTILVAGNDVHVGGSFSNISNRRLGPYAYFPVSDAPTLIQTDERTVVVKRNPADGAEVTHFRITGIANGQLYQADGMTLLRTNDFVSVAEGAAGLQFSVGGTVRVVSALSATPEGAGRSEAVLTMQGNGARGTFFSLSSPVYSVVEGAGSVTLEIEKVGPGVASVRYATASGSASAEVDFQAKTGTVYFTAAEVRKPITIRIADDFQAEPDEVFSVNLSSPSDGAQLAGPASAVITVTDNDIVGSSESLVQARLPGLRPPATGVLVVFLSQVGPEGAWRLVGEDGWRSSGSVLRGLTADNYGLEFKPATGYREPAVLTVPLEAGRTNTLTAFYTPVTGGGYGALAAFIEPENVATNADLIARGQWRRQGEMAWRDSGERITGLREGAHTVEFKPVPNRATPPNRIIWVGTEQVNETTGTYLHSLEAAGESPAVLDFAEATGVEPFLYNGQLRTPLGFGSGVVVKERVVLTAAHLLFDDQALSYVPEASWLFQKYRGEYEPVAQVPRGWYVFEGYAGQRRTDATPGVSSPESQRLDAAALYFIESPAGPNFPGRGGYGGYLVSDSDPSEWLVSDRARMLVGYPLDRISDTNRGRLHATAPIRVPFVPLAGHVCASAAIHSYPGNSGGPLYVQYDDGKFYPAGIYLGGSVETLVRVIDQQVADLINRAEISGHAGGNSTGGGVVLWSPGLTAPRFSVGLFGVNLGPPEAVRAGGAWRVRRGENDFSAYFSGEQVVSPLVPGPFPIEFKPVPGFITPRSRNASVFANETTRIEVDYVPFRLSVVPSPNEDRFEISFLGTTGRTYRLEVSSNLLDWAPAALFTNETGLLRFDDREIPVQSRRFYRGVEP